MNLDIRFDFQRRERIGLIEAIWGADKSIDQLKRVSKEVLEKQEVVFITRIDKEKEEALILVNWENKKLWKSISMNEVNEVQEKFEEKVKTSLNTNVNPFELIYEGELFKQG